MSTSSARRWLRRLITIPLLLVLVIVAYFAIGLAVVHQIDDDPGFAQDVPVPEGGSPTVATMAALLEREVDRHGWVANDPVFMPGAHLPSMAAYQIAIRDSIARSTQDLADGRQAMGLETDPDLEIVLGSLAMPGDVWAFDFRESWRPRRTSEDYYRDAVTALRRFNARVAIGATEPGLSPLTVRAILERLTGELNLAADAGLTHVRQRGGHWLDREASPLFFATKGSLYSHLVLVRALAQDAPALASVAGWTTFLAALEEASTLHPRRVMNGRAEGMVRPAHLAVQAALVLRAERDLAVVRQALAAIDA